jgi:hypothetical protein
MTEPLPRRMRSKAINLGIVGALAVSLAACGGTQSVQRTCVDEFDQPVPDAQCLATPVASPGSNGSRTTSPSRHWYYGGTRSSGGRMSGGSYTAPASSSGSSGSKKSGISIGGFGGSSKSSGSSSSGGKSSGGSSSGGKSGSSGS